jgi:hypothetical protein
MRAVIYDDLLKLENLRKEFPRLYKNSAILFLSIDQQYGS